MQWTLLKNAFKKKYTCIKFDVYMYNGHPLFYCTPPPPSPHLNGNFLIKKMLNLYISEAENMAL